MRPPYYQHPTVEAVASVLHDRLHIDGGVKLLRASARVRMVIVGDHHDDARVAIALDHEGYASSVPLVEAVIVAVHTAADELPR